MTISFPWQQGGGIQMPVDEEITGALIKNQTYAVAIQDVSGREKHQNGQGWNADGTAYTLDATATQGVALNMAVRRLTPRECERLQGFPDDYTAIPYRGKVASDGPRYKALGNSMAVPVMRWIGERIKKVEEIYGKTDV
jgi:site-specific DNA-cytosine methylase